MAIFHQNAPFPVYIIHQNRGHRPLGIKASKRLTLLLKTNQARLKILPSLRKNLEPKQEANCWRGADWTLLQQSLLLLLRCPAIKKKMV